MIKKNKDYDSTQNFGDGRKSLPKGGYVCKLKKAEEMQSRSGKDMVHIAFDIAEGEYESYFMDLFNSRKERAEMPSNVKYPFEGQMWIMVNDYKDDSKTSRKFKGFCTALEDSGTTVWSPKGEFLVDKIKGAMIGIVYQNQEQEYQGETYWRAIPWACRSVSAIREGDFFVPDDKPLVTESMTENEDIDANFTPIEDDDLPF